MPFNDELYYSPATKGDVAGVAIQTAVALGETVLALQALKSGTDPDVHINKLIETTRELDKIFDALSGWRPQL